MTPEQLIEQYEHEVKILTGLIQHGAASEKGLTIWMARKLVYLKVIEDLKRL